ncbi:HAD family phosphatase [Prevotella sp. PINT]|jgi:haloacid dehalogenase superfamily, subfamily IA, variant 3 with third motif having DD or ED|uniref:HAD family hydrolase n=1 Tax=Palleniella intestinalis TaxID=2736291 RepID=UPI001553C817|nr:HAD family phosphatase [Palleniella intestinalis]NPD80575.1 HAD family phosphatase [Palleniella intestinalis]
MIKNLIFDFGKVLVDYDFEMFFHKYIHDEERYQEFLPILCNEEVQELLDREEKPFDEIMEDIIQDNRKFENEIRIFCNKYPELVTNEVEGMKNLLLHLKDEGFKLYGLSNWCSKVYHTMNQFDIFRLLDGYVISSEEHIVKPEPEIYRQLFDKFNLKPEECVFTDDLEMNIIGARQLGMAGIVFHDSAQYETQLRKILKDTNP